MKSSPETVKVFAQAPSEALRPFVKRFVIVEFPFDRKLKLLPETSFVAAGYSDQSHFINDFKRFTGLAPSAFFQQSAFCKNAEFLQVAFAT